MEDTKLPSFWPITDVRPAPTEYVPEYRGPQKVWPDIQKLNDGMLAVDWWIEGAGIILVRVWRRTDHPNMKLLPSDVPKRVRNLYRADKQLALLRLVHVDQDIDLALNAWTDYIDRKSCTIRSDHGN